MEQSVSESALDLPRGKARADLAKKLGITPQAISLWKKVPVGRLAAVEAATGIPREQLRPDIFVRPPLNAE